MKIKELFFIGILLCLFSVSAHAQSYRNGIGIRLGYDNGISAKHFFGATSAVEGIASVSPNYFHLTGLYAYHQPISEVENLNWFVGIGAHLGVVHAKGYSGNRLLLGPDLLAGLEYSFPTVPFAVSLDWKPSFNFSNGYNPYWYASLALTLRYTLQ